MTNITNKHNYHGLVNNYEEFHKNFNTEEIGKLYNPEWSDNRDYDGYPHIDDVKLEPGKSIICRVPVSMIWSFPEENGGYDRTFDTFKESGMKICVSHLNRVVNGKVKGFSQKDAEVLSGYARPAENGKWVIVKDKGNHRVNMVLLVEKGADSYVLMNIECHNPNDTESEMTQKEAEAHYTDAQERKNQNEKDKFMSGLRAGDDKQKYAFNFLESVGFDYRDVMAKSGRKSPGKSVDSLTGLTSGMGNGFFKQFGEDNVRYAFKTMSEVMDVTGETVAGSTAYAIFALMFNVFTEYGKDVGSKPLFTKDELKDFFVKFFEEKNKSTNAPWDIDETKIPKFGLSELRQSGVKNYAYIAAKIFWESGLGIRNYYKYVNNTKTSFGADSAAGKEFIRRTDAQLKSDVRVILAA